MWDASDLPCGARVLLAAIVAAAAQQQCDAQQADRGICDFAGVAAGRHQRFGIIEPGRVLLSKPERIALGRGARRDGKGKYQPDD